MKYTLTFVSLAAVALLVSLAGCQPAKVEAPAGLTAEDVAAVGKTIDDALAAWMPKDVDRVMSVFGPDAVLIEYDRETRGVADIREKHIKPEITEDTIVTYKAADRLVRGRNGLAYVSERNIVEFKDKDGKTFSSDTARASYVFEKQADGSWKCVQMHWSGPLNWAPKPPEKAAGKKG